MENYDDAAERRRRGIGRPSKAEPLRTFVLARLAQNPRLTSLELLQGAKLAGYLGSKSAFYALVARLRPEVTRSVGRVGELPGDESQHGFGDIDVQFAKGPLQRVHFFVSQLSYSRWSEATLVPDRQMESLLRALVEHLARIGGVPLVAVFDRHNAAAIVANVEGGGGPWHPAFAQTVLDLGVGVDLRGRGRHERSGGSVERLVRWVKTSFFGGRRFADARELRAALADWMLDVNTREMARATGWFRRPGWRKSGSASGLSVCAWTTSRREFQWSSVLVQRSSSKAFRIRCRPRPWASEPCCISILDESASSAMVLMSSTSDCAGHASQNFRNDRTRPVGPPARQSVPASGVAAHTRTDSPSDDVVAKQKAPGNELQSESAAHPGRH